MRSWIISEPREPGPDLVRHKLAALLEEAVVGRDLAVEQRLGQTAHAQVFTQVVGVGYAAVFLLSAGTLLCQFMEVDFGRLVTDGDVDLTDRGQVTTWINNSTYDVRGDLDLDGDVGHGRFEITKAQRHREHREEKTNFSVCNSADSILEQGDVEVNK